MLMEVSDLGGMPLCWAMKMKADTMHVTREATSSPLLAIV